MSNNFLCLLLSVLEKSKCLTCSLTGPQMGCAGKMVCEMCGSCTFKFIDYKWNPISDKMIKEKRYAYQPGKHFCLTACDCMVFVFIFYLFVDRSLPLGLLMLRLFFMESWSCICDLLQVIIPSLMYSEIFQTWPPRNLTGWKGSLTQKIQIGRHQYDLTWLKFRSKRCDLAIQQHYQHIRHIDLDWLG